MVTGTTKAAISDVAHSDQGDIISDETYLFGIPHPPYINPEPYVDEMLNNLEPPNELRRDWFKASNNGIIGPEALAEGFQEVNYEERYMEHLNNSVPVTKDLKKVKEKLDEGRRVAFICSCGRLMYPLCPRRILVERLTEIDTVGGMG